MRHITSTELCRSFGKCFRQARKQPLEITIRGKRALVLLSAEHYDWLTAAVKRSHRTEDLPETIVNAIRRAKVRARR
jgi:prevent-host-death family protein